MRFAQLVCGPAGCGKSSYCAAIVRHGECVRKRINVVNLDPAAEHFDYDPSVDIRTLIDTEDVMEDEELKFGPNGALIFCMEYLADHTEWLVEQLGDDDDDYTLFDVPGQIEIFTHSNIMSRIVKALEQVDFRFCGVFLLDSQFITEMPKYISGVFVALSTMINLEISFVSLLTKIDLLEEKDKAKLEQYQEPDSNLLDEDENFDENKFKEKHRKLTCAIASLVYL